MCIALLVLKLNRAIGATAKPVHCRKVLTERHRLQPGSAQATQRATVVPRESRHEPTRPIELACTCADRERLQHVQTACAQRPDRHAGIGCC